MNATELFVAGGKSAGVFYCAECKRVAVDKERAEQCCRPRKCKYDADCEKGWTACKKCRDEADERRESDRFEKAEKVKESEWDGPVFSDGHGHRDGYFATVAEFHEWWECESDESEEARPLPAYVWACDSKQSCLLNYDQIIEDATQESHEEFDSDNLDGVAELKAAIDVFNEKNKGDQTWTPDLTLAVLLEKQP